MSPGDQLASSVLTELIGSVFVVTLNRPAKLNAMDGSVHRGLSLAWKRAQSDDVRAVVLAANGRGFCAGADLESAAGDQFADLRHTFNPHIIAQATLRKPVIAAINGVAAGAGVSLACAADIRIATGSARFVPAFVDIGLAPDAGLSYFLPRLIGYGKALRWLTLGRSMSASEALACGLVDEVVSENDCLPAALELANIMAAKPASGVRLTKELLLASVLRELPASLEAEYRAHVKAISDPSRSAARADRMTKLGVEKK
jgi:2-(1,2-epoxy-1,2-dihydrophenyl)acetyl-CoA isomerase